MTDSKHSTDKGSLVALRMAYYGEVVIALVDYATRGYAQRWFFPSDATQFALLLIGMVLVVAGLLVRIAAGRALGKWWSLRAEIQEGHALVTTGPYRRIRHPAYLGMLLVCLGIPVGLQSIWAAVVMMLAIWPAIAHRVGIEERLLEAHFGDEYREYEKHTARLLPGIF